MRVRSGGAGTTAPRDIGESVPTSAERCGAITAQGNGVQTRHNEADREVWRELLLRIIIRLIMSLIDSTLNT